MIRAMATPETTASTPAPSAAFCAFMAPGTYQTAEERAPSTAAPAINHPRMVEV